ncbi:MAG: glycosyltransferase family 2 protein [Oscillospiraceae bacterium]|nr:glycosyltransferase family 2 protein [Oscillospiraceae bacterium]
MKRISVLIPCYNEEENVVPLSEAIIEQFTLYLKQYDYEIIFIDNNSTDNTRAKLIGLCENNKKIKAIFNARNFGQNNSPYYGILQTTGDCTISMCADFQDPVELIPRLVREWEDGCKIVCAIKAKSRENPIMRLMRTCYYKLIRKLSDVEQIEHFTGTGLYDRAFVNVLRELNDPTPFLRGIVAELGFKRRDIIYEQQKRRAGKTHNNFYTLYDAAMLSFTAYTKVGMRICTISGFVIAMISVIIALVYLVMKLVNWNDFAVGNAPTLIGVFLLGGIQLVFIGLLGEYIMSINQRVMNRPLVIEERRINFDEEENDESSDSKK